jgi:hypothetical protein
MREFVKVASVLVLLAAVVTAAIAWIDNRPNQTTWALRIAPVALGLVALVIFLRLHFQRDLAPDYLYQHCGGFFDRGGLCFAVMLENMNGVCVLHIYFQNRFERPCIGRIALRPAKEFFGRPNMDTIAFEARCDGGAFGVHRIAVGIPQKLQNRKVRFEVGASVEYPSGHGRRLRFRDGIALRANSEFKNTFVRSVTVAGALGGAIVLSKPATVTVAVPPDVAEEIPEEIQGVTTILWRPGDAPI